MDRFGALPNRRSGNWSSHEDKLLTDAVDKLRGESWARVASLVPGRTSKSCRLRWCNQLNPTINKAPFSEWECAVLVVAHAEQGRKWAEMARLLGDRTDNAVKNQWNCVLSRQKNAMWKTNSYLTANPGIKLDELLLLGPGASTRQSGSDLHRRSADDGLQDANGGAVVHSGTRCGTEEPCTSQSQGSTMTPMNFETYSNGPFDISANATDSAMKDLEAALLPPQHHRNDATIIYHQQALYNTDSGSPTSSTISSHHEKYCTMDPEYTAAAVSPSIVSNTSSHSDSGSHEELFLFPEDSELLCWMPQAIELVDVDLWAIH